MIDTFRCCWFAGTILALGIAPGATFGRESISADVAYGDGVHAYFSGDNARAEALLAQAIEQNPRDPRPHYYRGLSLLKMGRKEEAGRALAAGAVSEVRSRGRYSVGHSLQRVQGPNRLLLEEYRRQARVYYVSRQSQRQRERYSPNEPRELDVKRQPVAVPFEKLVQPGKTPDWTENPDAFAAEAGSSKEDLFAPETETIAAPAKTVADDPFADDVGVAPADDPFAAGPARTADASTGRVPAKKMWGVMGRLLRRAAPVPSLDQMRSQLPFGPGAQPGAEPMDPSGPGEAFDPASESFEFGGPPSESFDQFGAGESDPFGESVEMAESPTSEGVDPEPASDTSDEDDLFGDFE